MENIRGGGLTEPDREAAASDREPQASEKVTVACTPEGGRADAPDGAVSPCRSLRVDYGGSVLAPSENSEGAGREVPDEPPPRSHSGTVRTSGFAPVGRGPLEGFKQRENLM